MQRRAEGVAPYKNTMFKSIFTKYIAAFLVIITISFVILAAIISALITNYSINAKQEGMSHAAFLAGQSLISMYNSASYDSFSDFISADSARISGRLFDYSLLVEDAFFFITDDYGGITLHTPVPDGYITGSVPAQTINFIRYGGSISRFTTLYGLFESRHLIYPVTLESGGDFFGVLFICSTSAAMNSFVSAATRTIIISCFWVLLATIVTIFFITDNIVSPLQVMRRAVKSFAGGHFGVRVPVSGNDEIAELAEAFNSMAASLARNEERHRMFLSNVSHDLRTPMTTIAGFIDGILDGTIPPEKHDYYLNIITTEIRRLSRLVSSLLDITRIQAGERKFNKSVFDICETARLVLISFEPRLEEKKLDVKFDADNDNTKVFADCDAMHQVMYNLIENAVKFSKQGGHLKISIKLKGKKAYVSVYNTGEGISEKDLPYVFDRFYKSDPSRGLDKYGVGLGLFIVKTIIDAQGEKITVASVYGESCEFTFTVELVG